MQIYSLENYSLLLIGLITSFRPRNSWRAFDGLDKAKIACPAIWQVFALPGEAQTSPVKNKPQASSQGFQAWRGLIGFGQAKAAQAMPWPLKQGEKKASF
jgi:hypothetical protein